MLSTGWAGDGPDYFHFLLFVKTHFVYGTPRRSPGGFRSLFFNFFFYKLRIQGQAMPCPAIFIGKEIIPSLVNLPMYGTALYYLVIDGKDNQRKPLRYRYIFLLTL